MQQEFGEARVFSAPIAEDYIVGTANGMSRFDPKIRVVIEGAEFADYFWPAVEQYARILAQQWQVCPQRDVASGFGRLHRRRIVPLSEY